MNEMTMHERMALDEWITGHYGEDQFRRGAAEDETWLRRLAADLAMRANPGQTAQEILDAWEEDDTAVPMPEWYDPDYSAHLVELLAYRMSHGADMPYDGDEPDCDDDYSDADRAMGEEIAADREAEREAQDDDVAEVVDILLGRRARGEIGR